MPESLDEITGQIIDSAYKLHTGLGLGLLESVYELILTRDLERRGFKVQRQLPLSFEYDGLHFSEALRIDLFVENSVVVEIKSVERLAPVSSQTASNLLAFAWIAGGFAHQLWGCNAEGRSSARREWTDALRVSAPPRLRVNSIGAAWQAINR